MRVSMNRPIHNVDSHFQRAVLRKGSDNKQRAYTLRLLERIPDQSVGCINVALTLLTRDG